MRLRTVSRAASVSTIASLAVASSLTWVAPAHSLEQEGLTVGPDQVVEAEYGPLVNNPLGGPRTPDDCRSQEYCDAIPLEVVVPPGLGDDEEYFVAIVLEWDTPQTPGDPVAYPDGRTVNDMDVFVYTDPPTAEEAERRGHTPSTTADPYIAASESVLVPEQAFLFNPEGRYWIDVLNLFGANTGYKLTVSWYSESFRTPVEKLAPEFPTPTTAAPPPRRASKRDLDLRPATSAVAEPSALTTPTTLAVADIGDDDGFDADEFDTSGFDDELAAPAPADLETIAARPDPPSSLALLFWRRAVPLAIVAAGGAALSRRRATL